MALVRRTRRVETPSGGRVLLHGPRAAESRDARTHAAAALGVRHARAFAGAERARDASARGRVATANHPPLERADIVRRGPPISRNASPAGWVQRALEVLGIRHILARSPEALRPQRTGLRDAPRPAALEAAPPGSRSTLRPTYLRGYHAGTQALPHRLPRRRTRHAVAARATSGSSSCPRAVGGAARRSRVACPCGCRSVGRNGGPLRR